MQEKLNGVDMEIIQKLVESYKQNHEEALTHCSATLKWQGGFDLQAQVRDLAPFMISEPKTLAGSDAGANPVEYILGALGACMSVGFVATATSLGIKVNSLEVEVAGDIDMQVFFELKEGNPGYDKINVSFKVDSTADDNQLQEILAKVKKLSPVKNTLERNVEVLAEVTRK